MSQAVRRRVLAVALLAPLAAVPALAWLLMEVGPERSFIFAGYLLVWAIVFLVAGVVVAGRRPLAPVTEVLGRAGAWALPILAIVFVALFGASYLFVPRTT